MKPIDLGQSYEEMMPHEVARDEKKHYPSFRVESDEKLDLPDAGTLTIRFRKVASESSERDGKKHYSCTLEVKKILDVEADKDESPTKKYNGAEDALDKLMAEKMKEGY